MQINAIGGGRVSVENLPYLVADIGGTNARFALADQNGVVVNSVRRYRNSGFPAFTDVLARYLGDVNTPKLSGCCVAVAGPVAPREASLTNRNWAIRAVDLAIHTSGGPVKIVNDLVALGYAVATMRPDSLEPVVGATSSKYANGQKLIVGLGTGLNATAVRTGDSDAQTVCIAAEIGHSALPMAVYNQLVQDFSERGAAHFTTAEDCFSGRGLSLMFVLICGREDVSGASIVTLAEQGDADACEVIRIFSTLFGIFCHELLFHYMPLSGIYLAGSVARGVFGRGENAAFIAAFRRPTLFGAQLADVPVSLIDDDVAALNGCIAALSAQCKVGTTR